MKNNEAATFWQHLDILRWVILRSLGVAVVFAVVAFCLKDWLFAVVLAPRTSEFITFRWLGVEPFSIHLMNTGLTEQFMTHMRVAMYAGLLCAAPYIIYELFRFVSPGLYQNERRAGLWMVSSGYVMFMLGTLLNYFLIFPLTEVNRGTAHPHSLGNKSGLQLATINTLNMASFEILIILLAYLIMFNSLGLLSAYHIRISLSTLIRALWVLIILREYCYRHKCQQQYQHKIINS